MFEANYVGSSSHLFTSAQANWGQYIDTYGPPTREFATTQDLPGHRTDRTRRGPFEFELQRIAACL